MFVTDALLPVAIYAEKRLENLCDLSHEDLAGRGNGLRPTPEPVPSATGHGARCARVASIRQPLSSDPQQAALCSGSHWRFGCSDRSTLAKHYRVQPYNQFRQKVTDPVVQRAIVDIAAMSTVRQLLPETLLPKSEGFPTRDKLSDLQSTVGALGVVRQRFDTVSLWSMIYDQLGRFLLTGLFYDPPAREAAELAAALNPDHLRLWFLRVSPPTR